MKVLVLLSVFLSSAESYKILVYSAPLGFSHMQFMGRIADILQEAGHDVTIFHPMREPKHESAVTVSAKKILFELPEHLRKKGSPKNMDVWSNKGSILDHMKFLRKFSDVQAEACDLVLSDNSTMDALRKEHFDVGITEMIGACGFGLFHIVKVDHIICASAFGTTDGISQFFDSPTLPSFQPSFMLPYSDKMNFLERSLNSIGTIFSRLGFARFISAFEEVWRRHGAPGNLKEYRTKINYLLSNSDEFLEFAHPTSNKIIHIGGITIPEKTELPDKLRNIMERKDRKGAVYLSFGTVVPTTLMPSYFREAIFHVAKSFPHVTFIWKMDTDDKAPVIPNLYTFPWLPQRALLAHPNLLCFISHAGLNSVLELTRSGKPSILIPVFGDQFRNARIVEAKNTTIIITKENFNNKTLEAALRQILSDESFAARARRLSSLMLNKPFPIKERLLSTVEFSTKHGKIENLDVYGENLSFLQYYSIDVAAFLSALVLLMLVIFVQLCRLFLKVLLFKKPKQE